MSGLAEGMQEEKPLKSGLLEGLLDGYAPEEQTFKVVLPKGDEVEFYKLSDGKEVKNLQAEANGWANKLLKADRASKDGASHLPVNLKEFFVADGEVLAQVYCLGKLAVHEDLKNNFAGFLALYRKAYPIFNAMIRQIDLASANMIATSVNETLDEEGKG